MSKTRNERRERREERLAMGGIALLFCLTFWFGFACCGAFAVAAW